MATLAFKGTSLLFSIGAAIYIPTNSVGGFPFLHTQGKDSYFFFMLFLTLQYCIGFAMYQNESATGIHVFPILNPPPSSLPKDSY